MTTNSEVMEAHTLNPSWTAGDIASFLGCTSAYVRATAQRKNLALPKAKAGPSAVLGARERSAAIMDLQFMRKAVVADDHKQSILDRIDDLIAQLHGGEI